MSDAEFNLFERASISIRCFSTACSEVMWDNGGMVDYLIIGAGLTGMLAARELAQTGASVAVVERGCVGQESSWAGGGILSSLFPWRYPEAVSQLVVWSMAQQAKLAQELKALSGIDPECLGSGLLMPAVADVAQAKRWAQQFDVVLEEVADVAMLEPRLQNGASGLWMPQVGQVRNPRLLQALHAALLKLGVVFHSHSPVTELLVSDGRIEGVVTDRGVLRANIVVAASGAWSPRLLEGVGCPVDVEPVKGQMLLVKAESGWLSRIVLTDACYLIPRLDGHILIGSTMEYAGFDKSTTEAARHELYQAAITLIPELASFPLIKQWAGLRPGSPQGVPFIGEHPDIQGLYVSAGHFRNGVAMGPASARLLADLILARATIVDPKLYQISRNSDEDHHSAHVIELT